MKKNLKIFRGVYLSEEESEQLDKLKEETEKKLGTKISYSNFFKFLIKQKGKGAKQKD